MERPAWADPSAILLTFPVAREHAGLRLDRFIQNRIPRLSRTRAQEIVKGCAYRIDGTRRRASERVRAGEIVFLLRPAFEEPTTPQSFGVLYEDEALMAVDKPAGLPVHPSATYHKNTLTWLLRQRYGPDAPHIAHRLDRETSGVVVCAKTLDSERALKRSFEDRRVDKHYLAIVQGEVPAEEGVVELPMARAKEGLHVLMEVTPPGEGSPSSTRYRVLGRKPNATLLGLRPKSGRQHQLRVHLAAIGHPIVGDKLYGPEGVAAFMDYIEQGMTVSLARRLGHERQALHAFELELEHPLSGERMTLRAPLPDDLTRLWGAPLPETCSSRSAGVRSV